MKKLIKVSILSVLLAIGFNGYSQVPIPPQTIQEYLSVGGWAEGYPLAEIAEAARKSKGGGFQCGRGRGCCWRSIVDVNPATNAINSITLTAQTNTETNEQMPLTTNLLAYYNSELGVIIFR